jgi:hypothetical protein
MVSASLRQNPPEPVGRNASATETSTAALGLIERADGYYDWAGRRLFLADRSPDPMTPGAYRYQAHPDLCDLTAPESDPASPRYEPPHLRHRPGDTWEIGGKPRDPDDPGPYGSAGWRPDPRTGRHRRNELPDPIPPWEQPQQDEPVPEPAAQDGAAPPEPAPPAVPDRSAREPRRRNRFWTEDTDEPENREAIPERPHRFPKLQEDAWDRFVIKSADLAAAHQITALGLACEYGRMTAWFIRIIEWIGALVKGPKVMEAALGEPSMQAAEEPPALAMEKADEPAGQSETELADAPSVQAPKQSRPRPGSRLAAAVGGSQTARAQLAEHWREQPRQSRPRPSPVPYMSRWERAFDAQRGFGEAVVL